MEQGKGTGETAEGRAALQGWLGQPEKGSSEPPQAEELRKVGMRWVASRARKEAGACGCRSVFSVGRITQGSGRWGCALRSSCLWETACVLCSDPSVPWAGSSTGVRQTPSFQGPASAPPGTPSWLKAGVEVWCLQGLVRVRNTSWGGT